MAEATWTAVGIAYLMTLGLAGLTLLLSSKLRSQLAIFAACAALIFLTGMIPSGGNAVLLHALYLFPINGLNDQVLFNSLVSCRVVRNRPHRSARVRLRPRAGGVRAPGRLRVQAAPGGVRDTRLVMPV